MLGRPETQSFTKFLISAGVFLCVVAFIGPGFALRDTGVLRISRHELEGLTSVGRAELEHRQSIEREIGRLAPISAAVLFVGGLVLIGMGLPRLRDQERVEDARSSAELAKLSAELEPQTHEERRRRLEDEVVDQEAPSPEVEPIKPVELPVAKTEAVHAVAIDRVTRMRRARDIEKQVTERIRAIAPSDYKAFEQVKLADSDFGFDALLVSTRTHGDDVVVEIKYAESASIVRKTIRNWADHAAGKLLRYEARTSRVALAWLVIVVGKDTDVDALVFAVAPTVDDFAKRVEVSILKAEDISDLASPISR